jgi:ABC-type iron transport system FetAB permease component
MVVLNLLIAVPIRGVRLAATLLLFAFVAVTSFSIGAWWLPGLIMAVIVTIADWTRRRRVVQESEENPAPPPRTGRCER